MANYQTALDETRQKLYGLYRLFEVGLDQGWPASDVGLPYLLPFSFVIISLSKVNNVEEIRTRSA